MQEKWISCPICGNKTRNRIRSDTVLISHPLFCPKCKQEMLMSAKQLNITILEEPEPIVKD